MGTFAKIMSGISESWKALTSENRSAYEAKYKQSKEAYDTSKASYVEKYVTPFKHSNYPSLYVAQLFKDKSIQGAKGVKIQELGKQVG